MGRTQLYTRSTDVPTSSSLRSFLKKRMSLMTVINPSTVANWLSTPSNMSMMKNRTAQRGDSGMWIMASVNTTNARPGPSET